MGKGEDALPTSALPASAADRSDGNAAAAGSGCSPQCCRRIVRPRCVVTLLLGAAALLLVLLWLPPFLGRHRLHGESARDPRFSADILASFRLQKPVTFLHDNTVKLQFDIFEEIGVPNSSVAVIDLEPLGDGSNWTNVVFAIWPYPKSSTISSTGLSILKSTFVYLVEQQSPLHLTTPLFGNSSYFQLLKFPGGITISPQNVFPLQKVQWLFNFTLNFPIYKVQDKIDELKDQMKSGLLLNSNENLYIRLTNLNGSTVTPPTIVQTSIVLAVGNLQPSLPRLKQLAQNIRNSSAGNLGLNHTVFGRVKQIRLSTFLQHSLNNGGRAGTPSPSPQPHIDNHHHHIHHHHHHHHHHHPAYLAPASIPAPSPEHGHQVAPPSGCHYRFSHKPKHNAYSPSTTPVPAPKSSTAPASPPHHSTSPLSAPWHSAVPRKHFHSPHMHKIPPAPAPHAHQASPVPDISFAHVQPPSTRITDNKPPSKMDTIAPAPHSSSASGKCFMHWLIASLLCVLMSL